MIEITENNVTHRISNPGQLVFIVIVALMIITLIAFGIGYLSRG